MSGLTWCNRPLPFHSRGAERPRLMPIRLATTSIASKCIHMLRMCTHDFVDTEDGSDVDTCVDITASVEWIEYDAVATAMLLFDDDSIFELLGDEDGGLSGSSEGIDHNVVGEDIEFLLVLALYIGFACQADAIRSCERHSQLKGSLMRLTG